MAVFKLMSELEKGRQSGEVKGWIAIDDVEASLGVTPYETANDEKPTAEK